VLAQALAPQGAPQEAGWGSGVGVLAHHRECLRASPCQRCMRYAVWTQSGVGRGHEQWRWLPTPVLHVPTRRHQRQRGKRRGQRPDRVRHYTHGPRRRRVPPTAHEERPGHNARHGLWQSWLATARGCLGCLTIGGHACKSCGHGRRLHKPTTLRSHGRHAASFNMLSEPPCGHS